MNPVETRARKFSVMKQRSHPSALRRDHYQEQHLAVARENGEKMLSMAMGTHASTFRQGEKHHNEFMAKVDALLAAVGSPVKQQEQPAASPTEAK